MDVWTDNMVDMFWFWVVFWGLILIIVSVPTMKGR